MANQRAVPYLCVFNDEVWGRAKKGWARGVRGGLGGKLQLLSRVSPHADLFNTSTSNFGMR